ncbi:MAG: peroxiredoxin-like family protein [Bacteroidota bacterium]
MKKLTAADKAISFQAKDLNGSTINLADYKGQKVLLSFFRKAACPFCNLAMQQLIRNHQKFEEKGIKVVALFASTKKEVEKYAGTQKPPFPIIPDADFKIYGKYGIESSYGGMLQTMFNPAKVWKALRGGFFSLSTVPQDPVLPAEILINENQEIHRAYYGQNYDDHLSVAEILQWEYPTNLEYQLAGNATV